MPVFILIALIVSRTAEGKGLTHLRRDYILKFIDATILPPTSYLFLFRTRYSDCHRTMMRQRTFEHHSFKNTRNIDT
jgi:hypothetical protein